MTRLGGALLKAANLIRERVAETLLPGLPGSVWTRFAPNATVRYGIVHGSEEAG